jgi:hypothetical protein
MVLVDGIDAVVGTVTVFENAPALSGVAAPTVIVPYLIVTEVEAGKPVPSTVIVLARPLEAGERLTVRDGINKEA